MTMRNPLDREPMQVVALDPSKTYRYTWPGQPTATVSGAELATILKGADASQLDIQEAAPSSRRSTAPKSDV